MSRSILIMVVVSLGFFFVTATTFTSLGYVLYSMVAELGWSQAAAGMSFSILGLACGLSSPLPPMLMKWVGTRLTMFLGGLALAVGFLLAATVQGIGVFFVATALMGVGFSLVAPSPAVYLLASWFPKTSSRMIGFYFMAGAFGGVVGPLVVGAIVSTTGSWRTHWMVMSVAALAVGLMSLAAVKDAVPVIDVSDVKNAGLTEKTADAQAKPVSWSVRQALTSRSFVLLALAMMIVQTVVTTMHSSLVAHVASFGHGPAAGAFAMSLLALTGTLAKGVTGALSEKVNPKLLLVWGLALQCAAMLLLCVAGTPALAYVSALLFGVGWGLSWLSAHVLLLRYFGGAIAGEMVAMATMATTLAVIGPLVAGWSADTTKSFTPVFLAFAGLLAMAVVVTALFLRPPAPARRADGRTAPNTSPSARRP
ncbi:MFS transporter [Caulobacter sp. RL271]|uniref:MFS transporter n=1 Tax=Caulobacter segnis TaxID=88688 RepID=A0ABY4ZRJ8_9CAUL|nr:MFS transporter [Caulobacter segnis]USQ95315.1 MFS transporter [Caulobacter segnis]